MLSTLTLDALECPTHDIDKLQMMSSAASLILQ
jgi:hypothetical protein